MEDVAFVVILVAFFAVMALFVKACDLLIGPDEEALADRGSAPSPAAPTPDVADQKQAA